MNVSRLMTAKIISTYFSIAAKNPFQSKAPCFCRVLLLFHVYWRILSDQVSLLYISVNRYIMLI